MPFAVKSQKTEHLPGAPFRLMGQHPHTPSTENSSLTAHRSVAIYYDDTKGPVWISLYRQITIILKHHAVRLLQL